MITEIKNFRLKERNTFGMDVSCRRLISYTLPQEVPQVLRMLKPGEKWFHLGGGSNVLFTGNYDGTILLNLGHNFTIYETGNWIYPPGTVFADAGAVLDDVIAAACEKGLWGIENLSGIPGTIGGAAVQNVGAYGQEIGNSIIQLLVYDTVESCQCVIMGEECDYGYRHSMFKEPENEGRYIILSVMLGLSAEPRPLLDYGNLRTVVGDASPLSPAVMRDAVIETRRGKLPDPAETGSAGSFFKNPVINADEFEKFTKRVGNNDFPRYALADGSFKIPAAWLIEKAGWKGHSDGNAAVWHKQPLVLVNSTGQATPSEILNLEHKIIDSVKERFGIELTPEVIHI